MLSLWWRRIYHEDGGSRSLRNGEMIYLGTHCHREDSNLQRDLALSASKINDGDSNSSRENTEINRKRFEFLPQVSFTQTSRGLRWEMCWRSVSSPEIRRGAGKDTTNDGGTEGWQVEWFKSNVTSLCINDVAPSLSVLNVAPLLRGF